MRRSHLIGISGLALLALATSLTTRALLARPDAPDAAPDAPAEPDNRGNPAVVGEAWLRIEPPAVEAGRVVLSARVRAWHRRGLAEVPALLVEDHDTGAPVLSRAYPGEPLTAGPDEMAERVVADWLDLPPGRYLLRFGTIAIPAGADAAAVPAPMRAGDFDRDTQRYVEVPMPDA